MLNNDESKKKKDVSLWKAFTTELKDRWFSSRNRVLKTCGVFLMPFIYGFVCIAAFWNPLANIGSVPISLASLDKEQLFVEDFDASGAATGNKEIAMGIADKYSIDDGANWIDLYDQNGKLIKNYDDLPEETSLIKTQIGTILNYQHTLSSSGSYKWVSLVDSMMDRWQDGILADGFKYDTKKNVFKMDTGSGFAIQNIKYHNVNNINEGDSINKNNWMHDANDLASLDKTDDGWKWNVKNNNDYAQISIPANTSECLMNYLDASISQNDESSKFLEILQDEKVNFYITYAKSFLAARLLDNASQTLSSVISASLPAMALTEGSGLIKDIYDEVVAPVEYDENPKTANLGYTWQYMGTEEAQYDLSFSDHSYWESLATSESNINETAAVTFEPGHYYTIPNEEYRDELISAVTVKDGNNEILTPITNKLTYGAYAVPSIEGYTIGGDANTHWNKYNAATAHDSNINRSLLHRIKTITTILSQIPNVPNAIASVLNFTINSKLATLFKNINTSNKIVSIDIQPVDVIQLMQSDQFLSSVLEQDSRYMSLDATAPSVDTQILILGTVPLSFGRLLSLMCWNIPTLNINIYQSIGLRGLYMPNTTSYSVNGNLIDDIFGNDVDNFSRAINVFDLDSGTNESDLSIFTLGTNILNNTDKVTTYLSNTFSTLSINAYLDTNVIGGDINYYGLGLGQYFVCIGITMGTLTQIMLYDKKKRVRKIKPRKWYLSKGLVMMATSFVQTNIFAIAIDAVGWFVIGSAFAYQWLFMLFAALIFISIIQSLWFCFRDRSMAFFAVVVFMVLNLAAGWGTFPSFMQFPFFHAISYILPFTYMIHIQGAIVFGIGTGTHVMANSLYILQNIGILLVFPAIFIPLGLFMSTIRERDIYYGIHNKKKLGKVLMLMGLSQYCDENGNADWKKLPEEPMHDVAIKALEMHPFDKTYKWYDKSIKEIDRDTIDFDNN